MNKLDNSLINYLSSHFTPSEILIVMKLCYYGDIAWEGHESGDWFFKSIRDMAGELSLNKETVQNTYQKIPEKIEQGILPFLELKLEKKKNFIITYFKFTKNQIKESLFHRDKNHCTDNEYSEESTVRKNQTVLYGKTRQYCTEKPDGINIVTHNNNSMSIRDAREDHKPDDQQMIEVTNRQTDDSLKMVEIWNSIIRPSKPETMTDRREQQCLEVLRDHFNNDLDQWREHCVKISQSSWLTGDDFTLYLGWALKPEHIQEIRNGKYVDSLQKQKKKALAESSKQLPTIPLDEALSDCTSEVDRKVKEVLFHKMDPNAYASWIGKTGENAVVFEVKNGYICVNSCNKFFEDTIKTKFWGDVERAYAAVYNSLDTSKTSLIDHREGVDVDLLIYGNKPLTSSGDVLWAK